MSIDTRLLERLAAPGAVLAPRPSGKGFGVFPQGDRRRRPIARADDVDVRKLSADGALDEISPCVFVLNAAGAARLQREQANEGEAYLAQHAPVIARNVIDARGRIDVVRGLDAHDVMRRLGCLRDANGAAWLSDTELEAAARLRRDWEASQRGLVRGSDWRAPPRSGGPRGPAGAAESAILNQSEALRRVAQALEALAPPLRRVVERVCLHEDGLEALERAEGWPARSGKLALKLGLAQLAAR